MYFAYSHTFLGKGHRAIGSSASDSPAQKQQFDSDKHTSSSAHATDQPCLCMFGAFPSDWLYPQICLHICSAGAPSKLPPHPQHGEAPTQTGRRGDVQPIDVTSQPGQVLLTSQRDRSFLAKVGGHRQLRG